MRHVQKFKQLHDVGTIDMHQRPKGLLEAYAGKISRWL